MILFMFLNDLVPMLHQLSIMVVMLNIVPNLPYFLEDAITSTTSNAKQSLDNKSNFTYGNLYISLKQK